ncbi:hypothetical protein TWF569_006251 [Orbilia oligospora]|uniref:Uncharacterized protein n=1 Tax=Orbilia oligospora TaxID=2813651 RepID=A0A7C8NBN9_ORBOL|nr:hypothetical protein TWF706_004621 [Orbilia oligospora]KAF3113494.1 hypothetical protein TWF102_000153 [Orbilia oligospora]KAF3146788.1 hypothetical protein TWF569_006251 [Orbilia oligospora]
MSSTPNTFEPNLDNSEQRESGFRENSSRIFSFDKTDATLYWGEECAGLRSIEEPWRGRPVDNGLIKLFQRSRDVANTFVFLRQTHSWGRLLITYPSFRLLQSKLSVFTPFLDLVSNHGFKTSDVDEHEIYHYSRSYGTSVELCYTIWYPARNGRKNGGNPWSMRKFTAYENQQPGASKKSTGIFIQVPDDTRSKLVEICKNDRTQPILKHILLISAFDYNWSGYLMQFRDDLISKTQEWLYYPVGKEPVFEQRNAILQDQRNLEILRRELLIVHQRLLANGYVIRMMQLQLEDHSNIWHSGEDESRDPLKELHELSVRNKIRQDYVEFEVKKLDGASVLLSRLSSFPSEGTQIRVTTEHHSESILQKEPAVVSGPDGVTTPEASNTRNQEPRLVDMWAVMMIAHLPLSFIAMILFSGAVIVDETLVGVKGAPFLFIKTPLAFSLVLSVLSITTVFAAILLMRKI